MYQSGAGTVLGVSVLPATGNIPVLRYAAIAAIVIGVTSLVLQLVVAAYRSSARTK